MDQEIETEKRRKRPTNSSSPIAKTSVVMLRVW